MIAIKMEGIQTINLLEGAASFPYGIYVGSYLCQDKNCDEFYGPSR